jgi:hypothetical protein
MMKYWVSSCLRLIEMLTDSEAPRTWFIFWHFDGIYLTKCFVYITLFFLVTKEERNFTRKFLHGHHDTQHIDIQHNDTQHNDMQHKK